MKNCQLFVALPILVCAIIMQSSPPVAAQPAFPAGPGDEVTYSLGIYRVYVLPKFQPAFIGLPACPPTLDGQLCYGGQYSPDRLTSPLLFDNSTMIGRSDPHIDQLTGPDISGATVGVANPTTTVAEGDFVFKPPGYIENTGFTEIHTAVVAMEMGVPIHPAGKIPWLWAGHHVLGQDGLSLQVCPGEVRSQAGTMLPGTSFFNVYVEALIPDLGGVGVHGYVKNPSPLLIVNNQVDSLPPTVIYIHENSTAVLVRFSNSNTDPDPAKTWAVGEPFGYLVLAGHGVNYTSKSAGTGGFLTEMQAHLDANGEMPLPATGVIPTLTEWGMIIFSALLFGWMAWVIVRRRRRVTVGI